MKIYDQIIRLKFQSYNVQTGDEGSRWIPGGVEKTHGGKISCYKRKKYRACLKVRKYFLRADKDGDGQITKEEWYKVLNDAGVPTTM